MLEAVKKQLGVAPNLFRMVGTSPAALEGYLGMFGALGKGALPAPTRERIALAVAEINACNYCLSAHTYLGKNLAGLDDAEMTANRNGASNDPKADAAVRFAAKVVRWQANQLTPEHQRLLASWPKTLRVTIPGPGDVLFCHATPRDENEVFTRLTSEELLLPVFEGLGVPLVVCGHTHMQFDRMIGRTRVLNAGSVGMPFGAPGADWLLLGPDIQLRHTDYDLTRAAERIRATNYPEAQDFAARNVLQPPSAADMLDAFTAASFR